MVSKFFKRFPREKVGYADLSYEERKRILNVLKQTGKLPDMPRDRGRKARLPGKRISKTGKVYWETRKNRSDAPGKKV